MKYVILLPIMLWAILCALSFYFSDESCLPYKRKFEKMLDEIRIYQRKHNCGDVEVDCKGKHFHVYVQYNEINFYYSQYTVYINGSLVRTFHILNHLYSKSRHEQSHGSMRSYEEYEIIEAAYKFVKKANKESFNKEWDESSYFN